MGKLKKTAVDFIEMYRTLDLPKDYVELSPHNRSLVNQKVNRLTNPSVESYDFVKSVQTVEGLAYSALPQGDKDLIDRYIAGLHDYKKTWQVFNNSDPSPELDLSSKEQVSAMREGYSLSVESIRAQEMGMVRNFLEHYSKDEQLHRLEASTNISQVTFQPALLRHPQLAIGYLKTNDPDILAEDEEYLAIEIRNHSESLDDISLSIFYRNDDLDYENNAAKAEAEESRRINAIKERYTGFGFRVSEYDGISGDPVVKFEGKVENLKNRQPEGLAALAESLKAETEKKRSEAGAGTTSEKNSGEASFWESFIEGGKSSITR